MQLKKRDWKYQNSNVNVAKGMTSKYDERCIGTGQSCEDGLNGICPIIPMQDFMNVLKTRH